MPFFTNRGIVQLPAAVPAYTGPGNLVPGASAWFGCRAYSSAQCGGTTKAFEVNSSVSGPQDILILSTGNLDWATINGLTGTVTITKVYDQLSANYLAPQDANKNVFEYQPSGLTTLVGTVNDPSSSNYTSTGTLNFTEPFATVTVLKAPSSGTLLGYWGTGNSFGVTGGIRPGTPSAVLSSDGQGHELFASITVGNYQSIVNNYNGASSQIFVNAAGGTIGDSAGVPITDTFAWGVSPYLAAWGNPGLAEFGIYLSTTLTGAQITDIYNNQKTFWGFP